MSKTFDPMPIMTVEERQIKFDIGKCAVSKLGAFSRDRIDYRVEESPEFSGLLHTLSTGILERKIMEDKYKVTFNYKYPSSWWEQLKLEKLPKWFISRYPVKYSYKTIKRTVNITRKATYPMADIVMPKNIGEVIIRDVVSPLSFWENED